MPIQTEEELLEALAEIEHDQWIEWSQSLATHENLSTDRMERWKKLWVPYSQLSEEQKEQDRKYARLVMDLLRKVESGQR